MKGLEHCGIRFKNLKKKKKTSKIQRRHASFSYQHHVEQPAPGSERQQSLL